MRSSASVFISMYKFKILMLVSPEMQQKLELLPNNFDVGIITDQDLIN